VCEVAALLDCETEDAGKDLFADRINEQQAQVIRVEKNHQPVLPSPFERKDSRYSFPSRTASSKPSLSAKEANILSQQYLLLLRHGIGQEFASASNRP
jgi:hypothetical protein